jgi:hypothetical protein
VVIVEHRALAALRDGFGAAGVGLRVAHRISFFIMRFVLITAQRSTFLGRLSSSGQWWPLMQLWR